MSVVLETRNKGAISLSVILLEILPAAVAVLLLAAVGVVHVTSRVMVVRLGYELSRRDAQALELQRANDALKVEARYAKDLRKATKVEIAALTSPAKLAPVAKEKLGMQVPAVVITVKR